MSIDARVFPDEQLPEGSVVDGETVTRPIDETFDFVVVGSGDDLLARCVGSPSL